MHQDREHDSLDRGRLQLSNLSAPSTSSISFDASIYLGRDVAAADLVGEALSTNHSSTTDLRKLQMRGAVQPQGLGETVCEVPYTPKVYSTKRPATSGARTPEWEAMGSQ